MRPAYAKLIIAALIVIAAQSLTTARVDQEPTTFESIRTRLHSGDLSADEAALLYIKAIKDPAALPSDLQLSGGSHDHDELREPSMVILEIRRMWSDLSPSTQQAFKQAFARRETEFEYVSPSGYFRLHYDTAGTNAVNPEDLDLDGTPDFVERCAAYCDTAKAKHEELGYLMPPSDGTLGGDSLFDVYFEEMGIYGYAVPEGNGPNPWNDAYSHLVINNDFIGFPPNLDPEGIVAGAAKATCAHEFHHCVQYAYDDSEPRWFLEMDAVYFEDIAFDHVDDNYNYLSSFFNDPEKPISENTSHYYSTFIYPLYLAQRFDTTLLRACWEGARYDPVFASLGDTLEGRYGWTQDSAFAEFASWNFITAARDDGLHHEEAGNYPYIKVGATHSGYPVPVISSPFAPAGYGACYVTFLPTQSPTVLDITFNGDDGREWAAFLIKSLQPDVHEIERLTLDPTLKSGDASVENFQEYYKVTLVGVNLSEFQPGAFFSYSATTSKPHAVDVAPVIAWNEVYSGALRIRRYAITNPAPLNDVYDVEIGDDLGWVEADTFAIALTSGESDTMDVYVQPPQGTPLGSVSEIRFLVRSREDTSIHSEFFEEVETVLRRSDNNFDGLINIADLTYLVSYLFNGGPPPSPITEAGDHNCAMPVNIADLTSLVSYLFTGGSAPVCNPY